MITFVVTFVVTFIIIFIIKAFNRFAAISEYRSCHIDIKNAIAFVALCIKKYYNAHHQLKFFNINDLVNLRLHKDY